MRNRKMRCGKSFLSHITLIRRSSVGSLQPNSQTWASPRQIASTCSRLTSVSWLSPSTMRYRNFMTPASMSGKPIRRPPLPPEEGIQAIHDRSTVNNQVDLSQRNSQKHFGWREHRASNSKIYVDTEGLERSYVGQAARLSRD